MANPLDIVYSRKNADGTGFNEKILVPVPNYFIVCDDCGDLTTWTGSFSGGGGTGTSLGTGSTYPFTASWAIDVVNGGNVDLSAYLSSSEFNAWTGSNESFFYGTSSFSVSASWAPPSGTDSLMELYGTFDGGTPDYFYGGLTPINGGLP